MPTPRLEFIRPEELHPHEAVDEDRKRNILAMMRRTGIFHPPLLVDSETRVILDGHHRLSAAKELGCVRVPCYCVDYLNDDSIVLETWRSDLAPTKAQVIEMGLSGKVFPRKTTRHIYVIPDSIAPTPLARLTDHHPDPI